MTNPDRTLLVNHVELSPEDVIVLHIPVGDLPPNRRTEFMEVVAEKFKAKFSNEIITFATRGEYQMTVIHKVI